MNTRNYYYEFASECKSLIKLMREKNIWEKQLVNWRNW